MHFHTHDLLGQNLTGLIEMWVSSSWLAGHHHMFASLCCPQWVDLWVKHFSIPYFKGYYITPCPALLRGQLVWCLLQGFLPYFTVKWQNCFLHGFTLISIKGTIPTTCIFSQLCSKILPNSSLVFFFPSALYPLFLNIHLSQVLYFYFFLPTFAFLEDLCILLARISCLVWFGPLR